MSEKINKNAPVICAECEKAQIIDHNLFCEEKKRKVYNAKPNWCPYPTYSEGEIQETFL